ncbi:unnamed protein product [Brugia timori]|uniref:Transposase n=1 Tax=Brugia timori TaxID=42155 RepID=A0A0R3Q6U4_9BILA|nr:unnamed protein product [Brugia timori]
MAQIDPTALIQAYIPFAKSRMRVLCVVHLNENE